MSESEKHVDKVKPFINFWIQVWNERSKDIHGYNRIGWRRGGEQATEK